jgi:hypothetical protein
MVEGREYNLFKNSSYLAAASNQVWVRLGLLLLQNSQLLQLYLPA